MCEAEGYCVLGDRSVVVGYCVWGDISGIVGFVCGE